ncbi:MAG: TrlF family AAA-like ATPase [Leptospirales bacterium]
MTCNDRADWGYPGARWWKFDFHTHTPISKDTPWHALIGKGDEPSPEQWLQRYMDAGIDCVAVTDHNSGAWIDPLKTAYEKMYRAKGPGFRELHLFPGVEISVNAGFHMLAIFEKSKTTADIDTLLGKVDYAGTKGDSDGVARKSPIEVIQAVLDADGIPIPAHVDDEKGLLCIQDHDQGKAALDSNTLRQVLECPDILAIEVVDRARSKPTLYAELGLSWSEVIGSDCHNFRNGNLPGSRYTWIKMAIPSLEGVRLALMDGEGFSIRRNDDPVRFDPFSLPEHFIEALEITEARYMGRGSPANLKFNPWFNALIGGRGTGKSTVVHLSRLALRREGELKHLDVKSEPRMTFERFNRVARNRADEGGLKDNTSATLTLMRDGVRHLLHWRQGGAGVAVEEEGDNGLQASSSQSITSERFPVRIFSQGQIAALADEGQEALLGVIDEAAGISTQKAALDEARSKFLALRSQVRELESQLQGRDVLTVQLDDVKRKLQRFEEAHHAEILKGYQRYNRQRREIDRQFETAGEIAQRIEASTETLQPEDLPDGLFDATKPEDAEALAVVAALAGVVRSAAAVVSESAQKLRAAVAAQRTELARTAWQGAVDKAANDYQTLVDALKEQGVTDPSEYGRLVQERQRLDGEIKRLASLEDRRDKMAEQGRAQLAKVLEARRAISRARQGFLAQALAQNPFVRIGLLPYGRDPLSAERSMRELLGAPPDKYNDDIFLAADDNLSAKGLVAELYRDLPDEASQTTVELESRLQVMRERLTRACQGEGNPFGAWFSKFLLAESGKRPELLDRVLTWFPEDSLQVQYSRKGDGTNFQSITQASAGQRAAAMLAFLLAHGEEPLILDQPEDDLDNHLIYDLVVRQIRENKLRRQIIVVTHNPNIVVNGDAEMLHALDFAAGQCLVAQSGSLQEKTMREEVCRVMEGGHEAFERRYRRLGREVH